MSKTIGIDLLEVELSLEGRGMLSRRPEVSRPLWKSPTSRRSAGTARRLSAFLGNHDARFDTDRERGDDDWYAR